MDRLKLTQSLIYRGRYIIGYSLIALILVSIIVLASWQSPGGISAAEQSSTVTSSSLDFQNGETFAVTNMPYHVLQRIGFSIFGISDLTIKLPSIILAMLTAVGLVFLLRRWFRPSISVLASLIAITTGQFIFVAQSGNPSVLYIFWPTVILLLGTQLVRSVKWRYIWLILFGISVGLSLYTPLSIYILLAIGVTMLLHPHLRLIVRKLPRSSVLIAGVAFLATVTPLIYLITTNGSFGLSLIGILRSTELDIVGNSITLLTNYLGFWLPNSSTVMTPVFGLGSFALAAIGLFYIIREYHSSQSHLILAWIVLLIPVQLLEPRFTTAMFIPVLLLIATGLTYLISHWYKLFPKNPYARVAGLIPLVVLVGTLMGSGLDRYFYGYHYDSSVADQFSRDLRILPKDTTQLVVSESELPFYQAVAKYRDNLNVSTTPSSEDFLATRLADRPESGYEISRIITTPQTEDADRFYVYKKTVE